MTARLIIKVDYDTEKYKDKPGAVVLTLIFIEAIFGPLITVGSGWLVRQFI